MSVRGIKVEFSKLMNYLSKPGDKTILFQTQMHAPKYKHTKILKGCLPCMLISFRVYKLQYISFMVFKNAGQKFKQSDQINIEKYTPLPSHKKVTR